MPSVRDRGAPRLRRGVPSERGLGGPPELAPQVLTARESRDATAAPGRPERKGAWGAARAGPSSPHGARIEGRHGCAEASRAKGGLGGRPELAMQSRREVEVLAHAR